jgi:hypothetical protein
VANPKTVQALRVNARLIIPSLFKSFIFVLEVDVLIKGIALKIVVMGTT